MKNQTLVHKLVSRLLDQRDREINELSNPDPELIETITEEYDSLIMDLDKILNILENGLYNGND